MGYSLLVLMSIGLSAGLALAAVHTEAVEYRDGDTVMEGYLAFDDSSQAKRPGVLVVHEWYGLNDYAKMRARQLAQMGYVAFAADIYGKGKRATTGEEAAKLAAPFRSDPAMLRRRTAAALKVLRQRPNVQKDKLAAIGFCFGGTAVLELARSGADVQAVVSFHGALATRDPNDAKNIKAHVLVLHGADDPHVPLTDVEAFENEMRSAHVDWQLIAYGGAVHGFTNPAAGDDPSKGVAYNAAAAARSWQAMQMFFAETIGRPKQAGPIAQSPMSRPAPPAEK
jgi:dienelactone hydrolase